MSMCEHPHFVAAHRCNGGAGFRQWLRDPLIRHGTQMIRSFAQIRLPLYVMVAALTIAALPVSPAMAQSATTPELETARRAVERADQADADQYAPDRMATARQLLTQAQTAQSSRDKKLALDLAIRAAADADVARALSLEAVANADLEHRRAEIADLQRKLGMGGGQ